MHDPNQSLVCFEEPENGVHPFRLKTLIQRLREGVTDLASEEVDATEPFSQLLLNSHSPVVLSCLESEEAMFADMVSVINPEAGLVSRKTRIRPVGTPHWQHVASEPQYLTRFEVERYLHSVDREN